MRLLLTLIVAFGMCLTSFGAATWPASTNGNNVFFGTNTFSKKILGTATNSDLTLAVVREGVATNITVYSTNNDYEGIELIESGVTNIAARITPNALQYLVGGDIATPSIILGAAGDITAIGDIKTTSTSGGFFGNGSNITNLTLPDPMTLNQLSVNTLIVTNAVTLNLSGSTNYYATNLNNGGSAPGQLLTATSTGVAWSNAPASTAGSTNVFDSGTAIWVTNNGGANFFGGTNLIGGTQANPVIQVSNNTVQFRNATANGTNIFYLDPTTGSLLWNIDGKGSIGASGANRPNEIRSAGLMACAGKFYLSDEFKFSSSAKSLDWNETTSILPSDATGGFRIRDVPSSYTKGKDRFFINGPVKQLTSTTPAILFTIWAKTNSFVGGTIEYTIFCQDAALESQALSGIVTYAAVNTNGVWTTPVLTEVAGNQAKCVTSGTLTTSWSGAAASTGGTTNVSMSVTATTSLTAAANQFYILWQLRNNGTNHIAVP